MKKTTIIISCCIAVLLLGFCGYRGYQVWKENHLLSLAKTFAQRNDARNELICLQQLLRVNPRNVEANRRMAAISETDRTVNALVWRKRVVELAPDSLDDRLALVQTAVFFKDFGVATNALAVVDEEGKRTFAYQNIAGVVAIALNNPDQAQKYFLQAVRLEPDNFVPLLNLSVLRIHGSNPLDKAAARIDLQRISENATNGSLKVQATRELLVDALQNKQMTSAVKLATGLATMPEATFSDKLLRLDVLREANNPEYAISLAEYEREAVANIAKLSEMGTWMLVRSKPEVTLSWLQGLPPATRTNQTVMVLMAQSLAMNKKWGELFSQLEKQEWAEKDFIRHAFLALALREQNMNGASAAEWALALKQANDYKGRMLALFQQAAQWNWLDDAEQILWTIVNRYPEEKWADDSLQQALMQGGRTRPLLQLFILQNKRMPEDLDIKNNLALAALLLDAQELKPNDLAAEVYKKSPANPSYATTYAFSLYLQKNYAEALKVLQKLTPDQLSLPANAGYYGLVLKATGDANAKNYLSRAMSGTLLPEEKRLFEQAMN